MLVLVVSLLWKQTGPCDIILEQIIAASKKKNFHLNSIG